MAIYQYNVLLIPKQSVLEKYGEIPNSLMFEKKADDDFEFWDFEWWENFKLNYITLYPKAESFLKEIEWTRRFKDLMQFGDNDTNDISFSLSETGFIESIHTRIDLRDLDKEFINYVLKLSVTSNFLLLDRQAHLFEPTLENLFESIKTSNAFRFVSNPHQFLEKFSTGELKPE